jgi:hypothetical protein
MGTFMISGKNNRFTFGLIVASVGVIALAAQMRNRFHSQTASPTSSQSGQPSDRLKLIFGLPTTPAAVAALDPHQDPAPAPGPPSSPNKNQPPSERTFAPAPVLAHSSRAKSYFGEAPKGFPMPSTKSGDIVYALVGTPDNPGIKGPDGQFRWLMPASKMEMPDSLRTDSLRANDLDVKLKDPAYRKTLADAGAKFGASKGAFLLPPGSVPEFFARILWMSPFPEAHADNSEFLSLASLTTPIKDQWGRGTCQTFAAMAEIESIYLRDYGITVDLSEQFAYHLTKTTLLALPRAANGRENETSLWQGDWTERVVDTVKRYSVPNEPAAPYIDQWKQEENRDKLLGAEKGKLLATPETANQELIDAFEYSDLNFPQNARDSAKYGVKDYTFLGATDARNTSLIEAYLRTNRPVAIAVWLNWKYNKDTGLHENDPAGKAGGHAMQIAGFANFGADDTKNYFILKNSWGGQSFYFVNYDFIKNQAKGATIVESVTDPNRPVPMATRWLGRWNQDNDGWRGELRIRRLDSGKSAMRLGSFVASDGKEKTLTARASNADRTIEYFTSDDSNVAPSTLTGQKFSLYQYSWEPRAASGFTTWEGTRFGVHASRGDLPPLPGRENAVTAEGWKGNWAINLDGWAGTVRITDVTKKGGITGSYEAVGQAAIPLSGKVSTQSPYLVDLTYGAKRVQLMRFTHEPGRAAGLTLASDKKAPVYGVHAALLQ